MGYENRLYIVEKTDQYNPDLGKYWARTLAMINLGKDDIVQAIFAGMLKTDSFVYADDGNTPIIEDCYGEPLREISLDVFIDVLEFEPDDDCDWSRGVFPLLAALKDIQKRIRDYRRIAILHYGY